MPTKIGEQRIWVYRSTGVWFAFSTTDARFLAGQQAMDIGVMVGSDEDR